MKRLVMVLASHADFNTTHRLYLSVRDDLLLRARAASAEAMNADFVPRLVGRTISIEPKNCKCFE